MQVTLGDKTKFAAKMMFLDCRKDPDYPHKSWVGQFEEMKTSVSDEFIEACYNKGPAEDDVLLGDKFQAPTGELMHVVDMAQDYTHLFVRINGSRFCLTPDTGEKFLKLPHKRITDEDYDKALDEFWANRDDKEKRVDEGKEDYR